MTTPTVVILADVAEQPWRNGGGRTRELLRWPAGGSGDAAWRLRISIAEIAADGPFSAFPGVVRWFAALDGAGVVLSLPDGDRVVRPGDPPLRFDGAASPGCTLIDGPTRDLNLMCRGGEGRMQPVQPGAVWTEPLRLRALYTTAAGVWHGGGDPVEVPAGALLWHAADDAAAVAWRFDPIVAATADAGAWWLGYEPDAATAP